MVDLDSLKLPSSKLHGRLDTLLDAPAELLLPERLFLYALVHGLRPQRCLEIGTHFGGSTTITAAALDDVGHGVMVCVDPDPLVPSDVWTKVAHRATMIRGRSPEALAQAYTAANGAFDFIFIDGDHTRDGVTRDIEGVLHVSTPGAHLLFHDSHYWEVGEAIDACLAASPERLLDCGTLSTASTTPSLSADGRTVLWGGFRMLRVAPATP